MTRALNGPVGRLITVLLFVILVVAIFLFLLSGTGVRLPLVQPERYQLTAELKDADNLVFASQVQIAGVPVGDVRSVERHGDRARVVFALDDSIAPLHEGATVRLGARSLVEESYLDITDGTGAEMPDGATLPDSAIHPSTQVHDVLRSLDDKTRQDLGGALRKLEPATKGTHEDTSAVLAGLGNLGREGATALDAVAAQSEDLKSLSRNLTTVLDSLDTGEGQIASLVTDAQRLTTATADRQDALAASVDRLPGVLDSARQGSAGITDISNALAPVAKNLRSAAPFVDTALRQLPDTTNDLRGLLPHLSGVLHRAPATLERVPTLGEDARAVVEPARTVLADLNPALGFLSPYGPDFAGFLANFNSVLQYTDEKGAHYLRLMPTVDERAQTPAPIQVTGYDNPYPAPGAGSLPGPFTGEYPRVERAPR